MAMSHTEEDVMKMRLLIDGDGTGDDRRLNMLLKAVLSQIFSQNRLNTKYKEINRIPNSTIWMLLSE